MEDIKKIQIDVTYRCNLRCKACNRCCDIHPSNGNDDIDVLQIRDFVNDSIRLNKKWNQIRISGGEPTLHPNFNHIILELRKYLNFSPNTEIELNTNGTMKTKIPDFIYIRNSNKPKQTNHGSFWYAPVDTKIKPATGLDDCGIIKGCGIGLSSYGYSVCAVSNAIRRMIIESSVVLDFLPPIPPITKKLDDVDYGYLSSCQKFFCLLCSGHVAEELVEERPGKFNSVHNHSRHINANKISKTWVMIFSKIRGITK